MIGALSLLGFLALASPSSAVDAKQLPSLPQPTLVADILPGPAGSRPWLFLPVRNGAVFFIPPSDPSSPTLGALWWTNGTPSGTFSIQPREIEFIGFLAPPGPYVWLQGRDGNGSESFWRSDGTAAGTIKLLNREVYEDSYWYQDKTGRLFFRTFPDPLLNLWVSDGTPGGTRQLTGSAGLLAGDGVRQLKSGPDNGFLFGAFAELGGQVFFTQPGGPQGALALWRTDGTPEGTQVVASPPAGFDFRGIWRVGSALYLRTSGEEGVPSFLWKSDGTTAGTVPIDSFGSGQTTSFGLFGELADGRGVWLVYKDFSAMTSLWVTDGSPGGAVKLLQLAEAPLSRPLLFNGLLYFVANDGRTGNELWRTDGTPAGTRLTFDRCPGECSGIYGGVSPLKVADRILTFSGPINPGPEPLVTDGTPAGTYLLGDLCPGTCARPLRKEELHDFGGVFFFLANHIPGTLPQLWATDLTPAGTLRVTDFPGGIYQTVQLGDRLIFTADDGVIGPELWSLTVPKLDPVPPPGPWLSNRTLPGFEVKVRITNPGGGTVSGFLEPGCIPETLCLSGAVRGRSEVFVRVVGPRPNGFLWPTLVKFTTSEVEVWIRQISTGTIRYYRLEGARPGFDELPGLFDRQGFTP